MRLYGKTFSTYTTTSKPEKGYRELDEWQPQIPDKRFKVSYEPLLGTQTLIEEV